MLDIMQKTPPWVYLLFIALLVFGIKQKRDRTASKAALLLLPVGMIIFSLFDMTTNIGISGYQLMSWSTGAVIAWPLALRLLTPQNIGYDATTGKVFVPGSWVPLIIIMGVFSVKYVQGAITALSPQTTNTVLFLWLFSFFNGVFFGIFSARIYTYLHIKTTQSSLGQNNN